MIDEKKLRTVKNYAEKKGCHRNWIYQLIKKKEIKTVIIDGVTFIKEES
jgi:predicted DNA-binding transcriptional regulator AlpA